MNPALVSEFPDVSSFSYRFLDNRVTVSKDDKTVAMELALVESGQVLFPEDDLCERMFGLWHEVVQFDHVDPTFRVRKSAASLKG